MGRQGEDDESHEVSEQKIRMADFYAIKFASTKNLKARIDCVFLL